MIEECARRTGSNRLIFVGSSKGAYAALNFSLQIPNSYVCIAAPQYLLGSYLNSGFKPSLESIIGQITDEGIELLDVRLKNMIKQTEILPLKLYLHVSKNEHTWKDHCEEMVADLQQRGVPIEFDWGAYSEHSDLIYHYPKYLQETVRKLIY